METKQPITKDSSTLAKLDELRKLLALLLVKGNKRISNYRKKPGFKKEKALIEHFEKEMEKNLLWCLNEAQNLFSAYKNKEYNNGKFDFYR